jgi:hemoglobin-like flavoprotein
MTPESEQLVQQSWALVSPRAMELAERFYSRLFEIAPQHQRLFQDVDMLSQRRKFVAMLEMIVQRLGTPVDLVPEVAALGARHVEYGVKARDYPVVGEALVWALEQELGPAMTAELRQAWNEAYLLLARLMERGARARPWASR